MASKLKNTSIALVVTGGLAFGGYSLYQQDNETQEPEETVEIVETSVSNLTTSHTKVVDLKELLKPLGLPSEVDNHQVVQKKYYTLSFNPNHKQADWVAYTMYPFPDSMSVKRLGSFKADPDVIGGSATLADYKGSGYDRGHLAPAKALSYSKESMRQSFYLSNMSPQVPKFNQGIWRLLEAQVYKWSKESDSLYVVSGPVLDNPIGAIGESNVSIPRSYYKTIVRFSNGEVTGIGFLLENKKFGSKESYFKYVTSIDSIEQVTGIDFYYEFEDASEAKIESNKVVSEFIQPIN
jgi:endonuclease G